MLALLLGPRTQTTATVSPHPSPGLETPPGSRPGLSRGLGTTPAVLLTIGVIPGARVGAALTIRTAERRLRLAVGVFLVLVTFVDFVTETRALLTL
jgi:hypothetical protein